MCKIYNTIGSFTALKSHLHKRNIHDFSSLEDVVDFQNSYTTYRQQIISHHENLIEQEKNMLRHELQQLDKEIEAERLQAEIKLRNKIDKLRQQLNILIANAPASFFQKLSKDLRQWYCKRKIKHKEDHFDFLVKRSIRKLIGIHHTKNNRYQYLISQFNDAVKQSTRHPLSEIDRKKEKIDELSSFIYGAVGEQKVVKTLKTLSDEYFLINDFAVSFSRPIYNRQEKDYIKSVQIDHILVSPSGIFLIETKNWSGKSLGDLSLRSPVQQIKRTSYVLFRLLNHEMRNYHLQLDAHHWGDKKIPIRNLIVFTNKKPKEEFQYVKILTTNELPGYIKYFKPAFSSAETQGVTDFLLEINEKKQL